VIVVIGAGLVGLAFAVFAAARGHEVVVVEPDEGPPATGGANAQVVGWNRPGVPHARQGHALLGLGIGVLREESPGVLDSAVAAGAVPVPLDTGRDDLGLLSRRLVLEAALRARAGSEPRVTILRDRVRGLRTAPGPVPHVGGVCLESGSELVGDLVVDASGRRARAVPWLAAAGARPVPQTVQACGFTYIAHEFELGPGQDFPDLRAPAVFELDYATVLAFPGDNRRFHLSTTVSVHDPLRRRLLEPETYRRFLAAVDPVTPWLGRALPVGVPYPMAGLENRYRRLWDERGPVATGITAIGDACLQTNPTFGRGVSLGFAQARLLARRLDRQGEDPGDWAAGTAAALDALLAPWFGLQLATDSARSAELTGGPRSESMISRLLTAMAVLRDDDEDVRRTAELSYHMLISPQQILADRRLARRLVAFLREHPDLERRHVGPDRREMERLIA
jgi:2-polyprenyl-6-methoxyphenol hydroxylase-like FAD-dependent oxidoreductase